MDSNIYTSPVVSGPSDTMEPQGLNITQWRSHQIF